jgi:hypothetical protein
MQVHSKKQRVIVGQKYNLLTAIKITGKTKDGKNIWLFRCDCGRLHKAASTYVLRGKIKSCGCKRAGFLQSVVRKVILPIVGRQYAKLTAIEDANEKNKYGKRLWWFDCECGNRTKQSSSDVVRGVRKSCGCATLSMKKGYRPFILEGEDQVDPNLQAASYPWMNQYYDGCSFEDFLMISQLPCHYCGREPSNLSKSKRGGTFYYNGLDRLDSSKDHSIDNVVPSCAQCNVAKMDASYDNFISWIQRVYDHLNLEKTESDLP